MAKKKLKKVAAKGTKKKTLKKVKTKQKTKPSAPNTEKKTKITAKPLSMEQSDSVAAEIVKRIREALSPTTLSLSNLSKTHKSHPESRKHGGGHYAIEVVSEGFMGLGPVDRQRWIMALVRDLIDTKKIHALQMDLKDPREVPLKTVLVPPLRDQPKKLRE